MQNHEEDHVLSKQNPEFCDVVDALAEADSMTIVVGAGVSIEANLPTWRQLLRNLLHAGLEAEKRNGRLPESVDTVKMADEIVTQNGVVVAASVARVLHGGQRDSAICSALYYAHKEAPAPGRIARALASLIHLCPHVRVVTTNYDLLLERAIEDTASPPVGRSPKPMAASIAIDNYDELTEIPIYHIHGQVPYPGHGEIVGPLVLDERDYALASVRPPGELLPQLLSGGVVLYVGASLTDPNLVASLHILREAGQGEQFGLFVRETGDRRLDESVRRLMSDRYREMGVKPVHLISYGQISQVLWEAIIRRDAGAEYWGSASAKRYGRRFTRWRAALEKRWQYDSDEDFTQIHMQIHQRLADGADRIRKRLVSPADSGERFGLHLWVRKPGPGLGTLELWGSSVHLHRESWSLRAQSVRVEAGSPYPAVEAVYAGGRQSRPKGSVARERWQAMLAAPVELSEDPWRNLIVGAITLSSNREMTNSGLVNASRAPLWEFLQEVGAELLMAS